MKGLSVWGFRPLCPQSLFRAGCTPCSGVGASATSTPASSVLELGGILSFKQEVIRLVLAWAEAETALLTSGGGHSRTAVLQPQSWVQPAWQRTPP